MYPNRLTLAVITNLARFPHVLMHQPIASYHWMLVASFTHMIGFIFYVHGIKMTCKTLSILANAEPCTTDSLAFDYHI